MLLALHCGPPVRVKSAGIHKQIISNRGAAPKPANHPVWQVPNVPRLFPVCIVPPGEEGDLGINLGNYKSPPPFLAYTEDLKAVSANPIL
jgi:hypothetical protein